MILQTLKLAPFAGLVQQELHFTPGLNVVLGPNEAGKSTVVNALKTVLFSPTQYGKREFQEKISPYLPLGGGDTIQVELVFKHEAAEKPYRLLKSWGAKAASRLDLPDGTFLADPQAVQAKMLELLVLREGTYQNILFAHQASLGRTLEALQEMPEPRHHLADLLRRSLFATDGVSVDRLEQRLQERYKELFGRWDRKLQRPEGNRGIAHPWKKEVGKILAAYYRVEECRQKLQEAQEYDNQLDALNARLHQLEGELADLRSFVEANRELADAAQRRQLLASQLVHYRQEEGRLKDILQRWPVVIKEVQDGETESTKQKKQLEELQAELAQAQLYENIKEARDRYERAVKKQAAVQEAKEIWQRLKVVTTADIEALQALQLRLAECQAGLQAGRLSLRFTPTVAVTIQAAKDLEDPMAYDLPAGQSLELAAGGRLFLRHTDWEMTVQSGEVAFEQLAEEYKQTQQEFANILHRLEVEDLLAARQAHQAYTNQMNTIKALEAELTEILAGQTFEELQAVVQQATAPPQRDSAVVALELGELKQKIIQVETDLAAKSTQLAQWQEEFQSLDNLLEKWGEVRNEVKRAAAELEALMPLPPEVTDVEAFISAFKTQENRLLSMSKEWQDLLLERAELQRQAPDASVEEITVQLREAERLFEEARQTGEALLAIQDAFAAVKAELDGQTLEPWLADLQHYVAALTAGRYETLEFSDRDSMAKRRDGLALPSLLLSGGARVSLGLAVRLSMAAHFLRNLQGFLILDDPLVDLDDAGRQQAAVQVIGKFAEEKQVIVLTCKESHADQLGGHRISLQR